MNLRLFSAHVHQEVWLWWSFTYDARCAEIGGAQAAVDSADVLGGRACEGAVYDVACQSGFVMFVNNNCYK